MQDVFSSPTCVPGNLQCTTAVLLPGWPQHPLLPRFPPVPLGMGEPQYTLTLDPLDDHTLVYTANVDLVPNKTPLPGPGIKQAHLILNSFVNPGPGFYPIHVDAQTGPGCTSETGVGYIHVIPKIRPSIEVTSVFNMGAPNTIYQETVPGAETPLPWDFLLWDRKGNPMVGVDVEMVNPRFALLRQGRKAVGHIRIATPRGASGQEVSDDGPSMEISAPISGVPTGHLTVQFTAGSASGRYTTTVTLHGGNSLNMFVDVP